MKNNYKQFIADIYHCSDCYGEKITEDDMKINLTQWEKEITGQYIPDKKLVKKLCKYWNQLCDLYPH